MSQAEAPGVLIDPAAYFPQAKDQLEGLFRCDISAVGAVAYGAYAGFVGWTASTRGNDPAQVQHLSPQGPGGDTGR